MIRSTLLVALLFAALLGFRPASAADPEVLPRDPIEFSKLAAASLQRALPDLVVEARGTAVLFSDRDGDSLGMTVVDRTSLCRDRPGDCAEALDRLVISNTQLFRGVADARAGGHAVVERTEPLLTHALWADERVWMQSASGQLSSVAVGGTAVEAEALAEPVAGLCAEDGHPVVATCRMPGCTSWTLRRRVGGQWRPFATIPASRDELIGLSCLSGHETIVTTRRLIDVTSGRERAVALAEVLPYADTAAILVRPDAIYVGFNQGAQGGGLRRLDPRTGRVTLLERPESGRPCLGLLVPSCDPVQAIVTTPWDPDCVAVAVGLVRRQTHGRIVEVCGDKLRRLYVQRAGTPRPQEKLDAAELGVTVAFTGLGVMGDELVAVSSDGSLHRIARDGMAHVGTAAQFQRVGSVSVNFDAPDVALVLTDVFRHDRLGGALPMLVPR